MTDEEMIILDFLKARPDCAFARREIARRAVKRIVFEENPHWIDAPLQGLLNANLIEMDKNGNFHVPWDNPVES